MCRVANERKGAVLDYPEWIRGKIRVVNGRPKSGSRGYQRIQQKTPKHQRRERLLPPTNIQPSELALKVSN